MLLLSFRVGDQLYACDTRDVVEVAPRVNLRLIPHAPSPVLGLLRYRGALIPVIDFHAVLGFPPCEDRLSTRIILTQFAGESSETYRLGVVAERVTDVVRGDEVTEVLAGVRLAEAPYLGTVYQAGESLVQLIRPDRILPPELHSSLFGTLAESP
ncbi:MAG: chemotaxis protein CheW [Isosphaeraceae bacterium]